MFKALATLIGWVSDALKAWHDYQMRDQGRQQEVKAHEDQVKQDEIVADSVRAGVAAEPERLRDHDEFERP